MFLEAFETLAHWMESNATAYKADDAVHRALVHMALSTGPFGYLIATHLFPKSPILYQHTHQSGFATFLNSAFPLTGSLNSFQLTGCIILPSSLLASTTPYSFASVAT